MKNLVKSSKAVIMLSTAIVGFLIVSNYNVNGQMSSNQVSYSKYKEIQEEKNQLISDISNLTEENNNMQITLHQYSLTSNRQQVVDDMKEQLKQYAMLSGINEVKGAGVVIKINDGDYSSESSSEAKLSKILHDKDVECVLNDIRAAGAEAISINDHRVDPYSGVKCKWAFIVFDDEDEVYPTFNFYCIGDPDSLKAGLTKEGGYINKLMIRGLDVTIEKKSEIVLKASSIPKLNYAKEYTKK